MNRYGYVGPKEFEMKNKKVVLIVICLMLANMFGMCSCSNHSEKYTFNISDDHDFRGVNLGTDMETVKAVEKETMTKQTALGEQNILIYQDVNEDGFKAKIMYAFDKASDTLVSGTIYYYCDAEKLDEAYDALAQTCKQLYGTQYVYTDSVSIHWKIGNKYVCILKSTTGGTKVCYDVCTEEAYNQ